MVLDFPAVDLPGLGFTEGIFPEPDFPMPDLPSDDFPTLDLPLTTTLEPEFFMGLEFPGAFLADEFFLWTPLSRTPWLVTVEPPDEDEGPKFKTKSCVLPSEDVLES